MNDEISLKELIEKAREWFYFLAMENYCLGGTAGLVLPILLVKKASIYASGHCSLRR
jgi:hypothetical protein